MKDRIILHVDINNCYASIELLERPDLRGKPFAVCGSQDDRRGIILAKNEEAKAYGIKTAETLWQARKKCPHLQTVPPQHDKYRLFSRRAQQIYATYTDQLEPFGLDECWLDVTGSTALFGDGREIAERIRNRMKTELGLTVSIGISFNKIFAKLGSDLHKPDAVTEIGRDQIETIVWPLAVERMIGIGKVTQKRLNDLGIETLGDLAHCDPEELEILFGEHGRNMVLYARGEDTTPVGRSMDFFGDSKKPNKSIGRGTTCRENLETSAEVKRVMMDLCQRLSTALHEETLKAGGIQITIKDDQFKTQQVQTQLAVPVRSERDLIHYGMNLFNENYNWKRSIRALTITAINLVDETSPYQPSLFDNPKTDEKNELLDQTLYDLRSRFGASIVQHATQHLETKGPQLQPNTSQDETNSQENLH